MQSCAEFQHCNRIHHCNLTSSLCWTFVAVMKIYQCNENHHGDENSSWGWKPSLWCKFIIIILVAIKTVFVLSWVGLGGKIEIKVHFSLTEAETGTEVHNRRLNHQPHQFNLKVLSCQVESLLSRLDGWGEAKSRLRTISAQLKLKLGLSLANSVIHTEA